MSRKHSREGELYTKSPAVAVTNGARPLVTVVSTARAPPRALSAPVTSSVALSMSGIEASASTGTTIPSAYPPSYEMPGYAQIAAVSQPATPARLAMPAMSSKPADADALPGPPADHAGA